MVSSWVISQNHYPPAPAVGIAGGGARDSEASAAACAPSLAGSSGADGTTTSCHSKARSVPQCHAVSVAGDSSSRLAKKCLKLLEQLMLNTFAFSDFTANRPPPRKEKRGSKTGRDAIDPTVFG